MLEVSVRANTPTFSIVRGRKNAWINFLFEASALPSVWNELRTRALKHRSLGAALRRSAIVTIQGSRGWDNYRLLHHFDGREQLDRIWPIDDDYARRYSAFVRRCSTQQPPLSVTDAEQPLTVAFKATTNSYPAARRGIDRRCARRSRKDPQPIAHRASWRAGNPEAFTAWLRSWEQHEQPHSAVATLQLAAIVNAAGTEQALPPGRRW
jgi:hypothetical protein